MKNPSAIISIVILAVVSFAFFKVGQRSSPEGMAQTALEKQIKSELVTLTKKDFEEYQKLTTVEDRYKKADAILEKIVTKYLGDAGSELGFKATNSALLEGACAVPGIAPSVTPTTAPAKNMSEAPAH